MPPARPTLVAAALVAAALPLITAGPATAATATTPAAVTTCTAATSVFDVKPDNTLWLYQNASPSTGTANWTNIHQIGTGWAGRTLAGGTWADGAHQVYSITPTGELRALQFNPATNSWHPGYQSLGTGFQRYLSGAAATQITVVGNDLYAIDANGNLVRWTAPAEGSNTFNTGPHTIDTGWGRYTRIFAAGPDVLYAVDAGGTLYRFRFDATVNEFTEYADPVGTNWAGVKNVFSPGGDVLYVTDATGTLLWFRYNDDTHSWDNGGSGKVIGSGWNTVVDASATTDTCSIPQPAPVGPTTPVAHTGGDAYGVATYEPAPALTYLWNVKGQLEYASDSGATGLTAPLPVDTGSPNNIAGPVVTVSTDANSTDFAGLDAQGHVYFNSFETAVGPRLYPAGGSFRWLAMTPVSGGVELFAEDGNGHIWTATDPNGTYYADEVTYWHDLTSSLTAGAVHPVGLLSVGTTGGHAYGAVQLSDDSVGYFSYDGSGQPAVQDFTGQPIDHPVAAPDADSPMLAGVGKTDGQIYVDSTTNVGAFTELAPLPGGTAATQTRIVQVAPGSYAVLAEANDGNLYAASTTATDVWSAWQKLPYDPTVSNTGSAAMISRGGSGAEVVIKGSDGKIWHFTAPAPAAGQPLAWTGSGHVASH